MVFYWRFGSLGFISCLWCWRSKVRPQTKHTLIIDLLSLVNHSQRVQTHTHWIHAMYWASDQPLCKRPDESDKPTLASLLACSLYSTVLGESLLNDLSASLVVRVTKHLLHCFANLAGALKLCISWLEVLLRIVISFHPPNHPNIHRKTHSFQQKPQNVQYLCIFAQTWAFYFRHVSLWQPALTFNNYSVWKRQKTRQFCSFLSICFIILLFFCHLQSGDKGLEWTKKVCNSTTLQPGRIPRKKKHASLQTAFHISEPHTTTLSCLSKQGITLLLYLGGRRGGE